MRKVLSSLLLSVLLAATMAPFASADLLLPEGPQTGAIRTDIGPIDLATALEGIAVTSAKPEQRARAERLLDLTLDGLRVSA